MIYPCRQCDFKATNKDNLTKHQSEHLEEDHLFQECCQQFTHEGSLIGHKNSIHESIQHHCEQCDYKASREDSLTKHHNSVQIGSNQIQCKQSEYQATITIH